MSKRLIETDLNRLIEDINRQNNHYIVDRNNRLSLLAIYDLLVYQYFTFNDLYMVNYFKSFFTIISKLLIYSTIHKYFTIYISKNHIFQYNYNKYFTWLEKYPHIHIELMKLQDKILFEINLNIFKH